MHDSRAADTCARRASCSCTLFVNYSPADLTRLGASGAPYKNQTGAGCRICSFASPCRFRWKCNKSKWINLEFTWVKSSLSPFQFPFFFCIFVVAAGGERWEEEEEMLFPAQHSTTTSARLEQYTCQPPPRTHTPNAHHNCLRATTCRRRLQ